jgi:YHS domain-containing protein
MMVRFILLSILLTILLRAFLRLWAGIVRGIQEGGSGSGTRTRAPQRGVQMERDPVCGTFVVPERAVAVSAANGQRIFFCSVECRDKYRSRPRSSAAPVHGRTA